MSGDFTKGASFLSGGRVVDAAGPPINMPYVARRIDPGTSHERIIRAADELAGEKDAAEKALQDLRDILDARELEAQRQVDEAKAAHDVELAIVQKKADEALAAHIVEKTRLVDEYTAEMARRTDEHVAELAKAREEGERLAAVLNRVVDQCNDWVARTGTDSDANLYVEYVLADAGRQILDLAKATDK